MLKVIVQKVEITTGYFLANVFPCESLKCSFPERCLSGCDASYMLLMRGRLKRRSTPEVIPGTNGTWNCLECMFSHMLLIRGQLKRRSTPEEGENVYSNRNENQKHLIYGSFRKLGTKVYSRENNVRVFYSEN